MQCVDGTAATPRPHDQSASQPVQKTQNVDGTAATPRPHSLSTATAQSRVLDIPVFRGRPRCRCNCCNGRWPLFSTSSIQAATSSYTRCLAAAKEMSHKSLPDFIRSFTDCIRRTVSPSGHLTRAHQASFAKSQKGVLPNPVCSGAGSSLLSRSSVCNCCTSHGNASSSIRTCRSLRRSNSTFRPFPLSPQSRILALLPQSLSVCPRLP